MEVEERTPPYLADLVRDDVIMWASDFPHERERDQFGGDLPHLKARKDLSDDFKQKMLYDNPVRFLPLQRRRHRRGKEGKKQLTSIFNPATSA